jgi:mannose-6-phosphate isomerase-like protein (cupin superfamily)
VVDAPLLRSPEESAALILIDPAQEANMTTVPPLILGATGERFDFLSSGRKQNGHFRFQWTLAPGRSGPPEHAHVRESETFTLRSGRLQVWLDGICQDLTIGQPFTVPPGSFHRFYNPGNVPVVTEVELTGTGLEDTLVPVAMHFGGRVLDAPGAFARFYLQDLVIGAMVRKTLWVRGVLSLLGGVGRALHWQPFPTVREWKNAE